MMLSFLGSEEFGRSSMVRDGRVAVVVGSTGGVEEGSKLVSSGAGGSAVVR